MRLARKAAVAALQADAVLSPERLAEQLFTRLDAMPQPQRAARVAVAATVPVKPSKTSAATESARLTLRRAIVAVLDVIDQTRSKPTTS